MSKSIDWATSRVEMLLIGLLGDDWRFKLGDRRRVGNKIVDTSSELLRALSDALREVSSMGPRMHECNHPTDEAVCDKVDYFQMLVGDAREANLKWFWCTRCGALGEVTQLAGGRWAVEWRRPEAPLSPKPQLKDADWSLEEDERRL